VSRPAFQPPLLLLPLAAVPSPVPAHSQSIQKHPASAGADARDV